MPAYVNAKAACKKGMSSRAISKVEPTKGKPQYPNLSLLPPEFHMDDAKLK
jgi:hypothetical protein